MEHDSASDEEFTFSDETPGLQTHEIHVRKQRRKGRKWFTTIENIPQEETLGLLKVLKRNLNCNGSIINGKDADVIQLQGDQSREIEDTLQAVLPSYKIFFHGS